MLLLEALIERARHVSVPSGYERTTVKWVLRIDQDGRFLGLDALSDPRTLLVPKMKRNSDVTAYTAIDNFIYTLGAGGAGRETSWVTVRHQAFRDVLATIDHPAARAIERFIDNPNRPLIVPLGSDLTDALWNEYVAAKPTTEGEVRGLKPLVARGQLVAEHLGEWRCVLANARAHHKAPATILRIAASPDVRFYIAVDGIPESWLTDEAVARVHRGRLSESNDSDDATDTAGWACSLCGEKKTLARLFPPSSKIGALVSFNAPAWCGYGLTRGHNAPTCTDCAEGIATGLDSMIGNTEYHRRWSKDGHLLWWPTDPNAPAPWPLFDKAIDPAASPEEREAALAQFTDGHFASLERLLARAALRRYVYVDADELRRTIRRWNEHCTPTLTSEKHASPVWLMAGAMKPKGLDPNQKRKDKDPEQDRNTEAVYLALVGGEQERPPPRVTNPLHRLLNNAMPDIGSYTNQRRRGFLAFAGVPFDLGHTLEPTMERTDTDPLDIEANMKPGERAAFNLGRLFARAEFLQRVTSGPQRTHFEAAMRNPRRVLDVLDRYVGRRINGKTREDTLAAALQTRTTKEMGLPARLNASECLAFRHGYYQQTAMDNARSAARRAEQESKSESETTPENK